MMPCNPMNAVTPFMYTMCWAQIEDADDLFLPATCSILSGNAKEACCCRHMHGSEGAADASLQGIGFFDHSSKRCSTVCELASVVQVCCKDGA